MHINFVYTSTQMYTCYIHNYTYKYTYLLICTLKKNDRSVSSLCWFFTPRAFNMLSALERFASSAETEMFSKLCCTYVHKQIHACIFIYICMQKCASIDVYISIRIFENIYMHIYLCLYIPLRLQGIPPH